MIQAAIVGCGNIAHSHVEGLLAFPDRCRIAALCDIYPEKAEKMLEDSARKALEGNPDRYTYVLPPEFHVTVSYHKHYDAEGSSYYPGACRLDPHTIGFQSADYYEVLRFFHFVL